jgi:hypothetical protein
MGMVLVQNGKIVEEWEIFDAGKMMEQLMAPAAQP